MKRIDTSTKAVDLFGAGKHGYKDGNKGLGIPATDLNASTLNALQEEVANVIEGTGTALNSADNTQLLQAINNLVKGPADKIVRVASNAAINLAAPGANIDGVAMVAGDTFLEKDNATLASRGVYVWNGAAVPATRDPSADNGAELFGGMIIRVKAGTVNADTNWQITNDTAVTVGVTGITFQQVGSVLDATTAVKGKVLLAQAAGFTGTGSATDVPPVAAIIAGLLGPGGASTNDYITIPYRDKTDGTIKKLIVQWGKLSIAGTSVSITFPITFPNNVFYVGNQRISDGAGAYQCTTSAATPPTLSGATFKHPTSSITENQYWFAIGN